MSELVIATLAMAAVLEAVGMVLLPTPVCAADLPERVRVIDGDTVVASIRVENVDTPELHGACASEREMAERARAFTAGWIADHADALVIRVAKIDRYGRLVARIEAGGADLGEALIAAGLGRPWRGRREGWCG